MYLFGFSNGGGLVWHMLCFQSHSFRAFAVLSQAMQEEASHCGVGADNTAGATPEQHDVFLGFPMAQPYGLSHGGPAKPVIYMHGTSDSNLDAGRNDPFATITQLIALNQTVTVPVQTLHYRDNAATVTDTTRHDYLKQAGTQGKAVAYYEIHYGDHSVSSLHVKVPNGCRIGTTPGVDCAHNRD